MNPPITVLQLTDTHLYADESTELRGVNTQSTLNRVVEAARADRRWPPRAVLATGDLVHDESVEGYRRLRELLASFGTDVACIPGNHDDPGRIAEVLAGGRIQAGGELDLGGWRVVLLDSHVRGEDHGELGEAQLAALDERLRALVEVNVLVAVHHHVLPVGSDWLDELGLADAGALRTVLARHPHVRAVLSGHVHQAADRMLDGIRYLATPSTCMQFEPDRDGDSAVDARPPACRWLELRPDGSIDTEIAWIGD